MQDYIDSHMHLLSLEQKGFNIHKLLTDCFKQGLYLALDAAVDTENFNRRQEYSFKYKGLYMTAGLSPANTQNGVWKNRIYTLEQQLKEDKVIGLGEVGLDYHWNYGTRAEQIELFEVQVDLAQKLALPLVIHNRKADDDILTVLNRKKPQQAGIMHCFCSSYKTAKNALDLGFYISFAGNVTYKNSGDLQNVACRIPVNRLLVETDAPYLPPQPVRGQKNQPGFIIHTYEFMAKLLNISIAELNQQVRDNFKRLFHL